MLRINQIKLKPDHTMEMLDHAIRHILRLKPDDSATYHIAKKSIDARHKPELYYIYSVEVTSITGKGKNLDLKKKVEQLKNKDVIWSKQMEYHFPNVSYMDDESKRDMILKDESYRPVIIGFGPAGIFAALKLAEAGLRPLIFERGDRVDLRKTKVQDFWMGNDLDVDSNVQFGEGGAGTFSDGKLNTQIKDPTGRIKEVLRIFVEFGADPSIQYVNKPHIGTDVLSNVVKNIREHIISLGGEIFFHHRLDDFFIEDGKITSVEITDLTTNQTKKVSCKRVCLALGHSARDTFYMLHEHKLAMEAKAFAVGLRMEHSQEYVNFNAYGDSSYHMPAADYKVTYQTGKRGVYSFCMCPGGYVVNASSEKGFLAVNGMSYSGRDGKNANSAMIVTVTPQDFGTDVLDGIKFQRKIENAAYTMGQGKVPVQLFGDFENNKVTTGFGTITPSIKGAYQMSNLRELLPEQLNQSLIEGIHGCSRYMKGFDQAEAVLSGVESRTSSPVRILRNDDCQSINCNGLYPCGEGAGYAGGITSAAVDGIKIAEKIAANMDF